MRDLERLLKTYDEGAVSSREVLHSLESHEQELTTAKHDELILIHQIAMSVVHRIEHRVFLFAKKIVPSEVFKMPIGD